MRDRVDLLHEGLQGVRLLLYDLEESHDHAFAKAVGRREAGELVD